MIAEFERYHKFQITETVKFHYGGLLQQEGIVMSVRFTDKAVLYQIYNTQKAQLEENVNEDNITR